jgi:cyclophilin family peptidyl-prolyl cis-trans isomerase/HEAT repeat protein
LSKKTTLSYWVIGCLSTLIFYSCGGDDSSTKKEKEPKEIVEENAPPNKYSDTTFQKIAAFQHDRSTNELLVFLSHENAIYRKAAAIALASVQDPSSIKQLLGLLSDKDEEVRISAAYALGQIRDAKAVAQLKLAIDKQENSKVQQFILEAIGKCGNEADLAFLSEQTYEDGNAMQGQAWGIYQFALQSITSEKGTAKAIELLTGKDAEARFASSNYVMRARDIDLSQHAQAMMNAFMADQSVYTQMNIARGLGKAKVPEARKFLINILKDDSYDYRTQVNAITGCEGFEYDSIAPHLFPLLKASNPNVAARASEYFVTKGLTKDTENYLNEAVGLQNWRAKANLLTAAMKYADEKAPVSATIKRLYEYSENTYEKAALLKALGGGGFIEVGFISTETLNASHAAISTNGIEAILSIKQKWDPLLADQFTEMSSVLTKAIQSGDLAMIGMVADDITSAGDMLLVPLEVLKTALTKLVLPKDIETYMALQKAIDKVEKSDPPAELPKLNPQRLDWDFLKSIPENLQALIKTSKGDILFNLMVNESPESVGNFVQLVNDGFYTNKGFHRVVPNFVAQGGCPRGDGYGGPNHVIRSEFGMSRYQEGSVGMASAGKDTESGQWFITHSPTTHLDGRYTIFATVADEAGMNVVHQLEVGDKIQNITLVNDGQLQ